MDLRPLLRSGPPTALVLTGDWRAVVDLQGRLHQAHPDTTFVHLRGGKMRTAAGFFDELAAALQFPSWFGENWDALTDIARFRGWFAGIVLGVYDAHDLLVDASDTDRRTAAAVLEQCNRYGKDEPPADVAADDEDGFHLLLQVSAGDADGVVARWQAAGLSIAVLPADAAR